MIAGARRGRHPGQPAGGPRRAHFDRAIDAAWRRTSYSGLIRAAEEAAGGQRAGGGRARRRGRRRPAGRAGAGGAAPSVPSPMADLPMGAKFGTLVHAVLETADPFAADLAAELAGAGREQLGVVAGRRRRPRTWPRPWSRCTTRRSARWPAA